nr:MAG TPA: minor capsid component [Caudoviricetes sp.]
MADFPRIPFDEAIEALRRRGTNLFPSDHWATVWQEQHHAGFTVARSSGFDILGDIFTALMDSKKNGTTFADFKRDLVPTLQKKGWWGRTTVIDPETGEERTVRLGSVRRLETIFDVNMRVSYAQGRWEQQQDLKDTFPYLRYEGILDSKIRPQHRRWHGIILPIDHPWWRTHYPPNGWKCRCDAVAVSDDDLQRYGWKVSDDPEDEGTVTWVNPATGEVVDVPVGIDPGWAYNPGDTDRAAQLGRVMLEKLATLPVPLEVTAIMQAAPLLPETELAPGGLAPEMVRRLVRDGFDEWAENPTAPLPLAVLSADDAASIGATARIACLSPASYAKQKSHHPELTAADYSLAADAVEKGEKYRQNKKNLAFVLNRPEGVVVIVKATRIGDELYVTSLRRLSREDSERERAVKKIRRGKQEK